MVNALASVRWKGWIPCAIVLALAIVSTVTIVLIAEPIGRAAQDKRKFLMLYRHQDDAEFEVDHAMEYVINSDENNEVVFFGDSTCQHGINIKQFQAATGLTAFNVSCPWIGIESHVLLLERYFQKHPKPKVMVLCFQANNLDARWCGDEHKERFEWAYGDGREESRPHQTRRQYITDGIGVIHYNLVHSFMGGALSNYKFLAKGYESHLSNRGASELFGRSSDPEPLPELYITVEVAPSRREAMNQICEFLHTRGVPLIIRWMPHIPTEKTQVLDKAYEFTRELCKRWDNVTFAMPEALDYPKEMYFDNYHLNSVGMKQATNDITPIVLKVLKEHSK